MLPARERPSSGAWPRPFQSAVALSRVYLEGLSRLCDPTDLRRRWVADLTEFSAAFLRSPLFFSFIRLHRETLRRAAGAASPFPKG